MTNDGGFVRVRDIDRPSGTVYCTNERGGVSWFIPDGGDPTDWEPGDVAFMTSSSVLRVDPLFWKVGNSVGEVTHASHTDVVIKVDGQSRSFPQRSGEPFEVGQLIEFVPGAGPGKVVGEHEDDEFSLSRRLDDFNVESLITKPSDNHVTMDQVGGADYLKRRAENLVKIARLAVRRELECP